ncbi:hypothetical protein TNCV_803271 [Trichonephila clavipes]|nr:hypothetical protein TNCV_803271 [Trichonephila clavipes]
MEIKERKRFLFRFILKVFQSVETALGFGGASASLKLKFKKTGLWSEERSSMQLIVKGWNEREDGDCKTKLAAGTIVELKQEPALITDPNSDVGKCI